MTPTSPSPSASASSGSVLFHWINCSGKRLLSDCTCRSVGAELRRSLLVDPRPSNNLSLHSLSRPLPRPLRLPATINGHLPFSPSTLLPVSLSLALPHRQSVGNSGLSKYPPTTVHQQNHESPNESNDPSPPSPAFELCCPSLRPFRKSAARRSAASFQRSLVP